MHGEVVPSKRLSNGKFRVDGWPCSGPGHVYVRFQDHLLDFLWELLFLVMTNGQIG
jgi:hypothetical protein